MAGLLFVGLAAVEPSSAGSLPAFGMPYPVGQTRSIGTSYSNPLHNWRGGVSPQSSIDFMGSGPVTAIAAGTVMIFPTCAPGFVVINHGEGVYSGYYHLTGVAVSNGQQVQRGTVLGQAGTSLPCGGSASGNHVHFTLYSTPGTFSPFSEAQETSLVGRSFGGWVVQSNGCFRRSSDGLTRCKGEGVPSEDPGGPPPPPGNSSFVTISGKPEVFRIIGGAPVYVSSWAIYGGPQPTRAISQTEFNQLPAYPADGTFVVASPGGHVFRFAGGAPLYVSSWDRFGGPKPTTVIDKAALDNADGVYPWNHVHRFPADGTFVSASPGGHVFRFAGGAPLYVSSWNVYAGGPKPTTVIDKAALDNADGVYPWNYVHRFPADGTFVSASPGGHVFRFAGGAPLYVSSWDRFGGPKPTTVIDKAALDNADGVYPWNHVHRYPADGTALQGSPGGLLFVTTGGLPRQVTVAPNALTVDQLAIDQAGSAYPFAFLKRQSAPTAPSAIILRSGSTTGPTGPLLVSVGLPSSDGGRFISSYEVVCTSSNGGVPRSGTSALRLITVTGATTGRAYTCQARARNAIGASSYSTVSAGVVTGTPPAPVAISAAKVSSGTLRVTYQANGTNGSPLTGFRVTCVAPSNGLSISRTVMDPALRAVTVSGLTPGRSYRCRVRAINARGVGLAEGESQAVLA